jgi:hypothetical protein
MKYEEELMDIGVKHERERIIRLIQALSSHSTHSEACMKIHKFADDLLGAIMHKGETK